MATPNPGAISLKLLVDSKHQKVLFAEAGKEFVDFLFTLLSLPVGTVIRLLSKDAMVGSLGKLYASVENLSATYMQPDLNKDVLLKPKVPVAGSNILGLPDNVESSSRNVFFMCSQNRTPDRPSFGVAASYHPYVTEDSSEHCPQCNSLMSSQATYVGKPKTALVTSGASAAGYVKGIVTYMIMDDLEVQPMSTISSITLLNRFNVNDVGALEEKVVELGMDEGVKLLKASLQSKSVLTNVFLGKKAAPA